MKKHRTLKFIAKLFTNVIIGLAAPWHPIVWHCTEKIARDMYRRTLNINHKILRALA
jgi:hypothetical protein